MEAKALVSSALPCSSTEVLGGEGDVEEGVKPCARGGWADAAKGGEDDGEEGALQLDAAGEVLVVLLFLPAGEEGGGGGGGGGDVRGEEGAGDGGVNGGGKGVEVVGGEH